MASKAGEPIVRERIVLESWRFTSLSAFGRELTHLLEHSDYILEAHVKDDEDERIAAELGEFRAIERLSVVHVRR